MSNVLSSFCGPLGGFFSPEHPGSWKPVRDAAMECRDVEEAIANGLGFYRLIRDANRRWAEAVEEGKAAFSWQTAGQFAAAYRWWLDGGGPLLEAIAACEKQGAVVEGAGEFREAYREVSLLPLDMDRVRASVAAGEKGQGIPFDQAMDELQDHLRQ